MKIILIHFLNVIFFHGFIFFDNFKAKNAHFLLNSVIFYHQIRECSFCNRTASIVIDQHELMP